MELGQNIIAIRHETTIILLYSLIIHSSMNLFSQHSRQFILSFSKSLRHEKLFFHSFNMAKPATFFANFPVKLTTVDF